MNGPIDIVITWVDGGDPAWLAEKHKYDPATPLPDSGVHHFRDWGLLRYLFRGIETFAPWVRTVHFVTWGHLPEWLDPDCSRLNIVRHEDYIPEKYLPTFSSRTIELNLHRINGLSEQFIYFNDDTYIIKEANPDAFFVGGLPRDLAALNVHCYALSRPVDLTQIRDVGVINAHFDFRRSIWKNWKKWLIPSNGKALVRTLPLLGCPRFPGFYQPHCAQALKKSTFEAVWDAEPDIMDKTCLNKVRGLLDVNQYVLREWQIASGEFVPRKRSFFEPYYLDKVDPVKGAKTIAAAIKNQKKTLICINDAEMSQQELDKCQLIISEAFKALLPYRSSFERL